MRRKTFPFEKNIAKKLWAEHRAHQNFQALAFPRANFDISTAYVVQDRLVELMIPTAGNPVGYKIGLTSGRMQKMCGIDQPIAGRVLSRRVHRSVYRANSQDYGRLGVESELCVFLKADVPFSAHLYEAAELTKFVGAICAAFELIDDRNADYTLLDAPSLIADNSWNAGVVLGDRSDDFEINSRQGTLRVNGKVVDSANTDDALGDPMAVIRWLANHVCGQGQQLRAGDLVMTGSIIPTQFPATGDHYHFELTGLPPVELWIE